MKKLLYLVLLLCLMTMGMIPATVSAAGSIREKSAVLLVYNNQAEKYYNAKLDKIAIDYLNGKIDGLYNKIDNKKYIATFAKKSFEHAQLSELLAIVNDANADYFVYTELRPFSVNEDYNLIFYNKSMTATMVLRIIDVKNKKELFASKYALTCDDETDYGVIGNPSMAKKSLQAVLFKVGEAISIHLPL